MGKDPQVTVVIPVHNGEMFLAQAVDSALQQEGVTLEVIVVDDASTDATPSVARAFGQQVKYVRLEKQPTSISTTNAGARLATGDLVSILHHDDYFLPGKLKRHVELMSTHPAIGFSYSAQYYVDPPGGRLWTMRSPVRRGDYVVAGEVELRRLVIQNYLNFCNVVMRRAAYEEVGPYTEHLWFSAEWEMWVRIALRHSVGYIDEPLVCYRLHPQSQTMAKTTDTEAFLGQLREVVDEIYAHPRLSEELQQRHRLSVANMYLSTALLRFIRHENASAIRTSLEVIRRARPWEIADLVRSSVFVPRAMARIRLQARQLRDRRRPAST